jgi:hypothetical protein
MCLEGDKALLAFPYWASLLILANLQTVQI